MPKKSVVIISIIILLALAGSAFIFYQSIKVNKLASQVQRLNKDLKEKKAELSAEKSTPQQSTKTNDSQSPAANAKPKEPAATKQFSYIKKVYVNDNTYFLEADFAEFYTGQQAVKIAKEDGQLGPDGILDNDYYIRNNNPRIRTFKITNSVSIAINKSPGEIEQRKASLKEFASIYKSNSFDSQTTKQSPYWLIIKGDAVTKISQQYVP